MYIDACRLYGGLNCQVGGGSPTTKGKLHGMGCLISPCHVLTALHTLTQTEILYEWPVVFKHDGLYRCEITLESKEYDVTMLQTTEKLDDADFAPPEGYPSILPSKPFLGLSVGYIAALHLHKPDGEDTRHTCFSQAFVSMLLREGGEGERYALSGGIMQPGFSGGPVFTAEGKLVGIVVKSIQFAADAKHPTLSVYTLPVMTSLYPLKDRIEQHLVKNQPDNWHGAA